MIDICITVYKNYDLFSMCINHWLKHIKGDWRILVCDNTPRHLRYPEKWIHHEKITYYELDQPEGLSDGESYGQAMDFLARMSTSDIIGFADTDIFYFDPNIINDVESDFANGIKCVGLAGFYHDWQQFHDPRFPNRRGDQAPVSIGFFITRELALQQTFIVTDQEGCQQHEQMWRLREYLIEHNIPRVTLPGFYDPEIRDPLNPQGMVFYGWPEVRIALHILKGSFGNAMNYDLINRVVETESKKW